MAIPRHLQASNESIFKDRRENTNEVHKRLCRRNKNSFAINSIDNRPWWLKVNYLTTQSK